MKDCRQGVGWSHPLNRFVTKIINASTKPALLWTFVIGIIGVSSSGVWLPYVFDSSVDCLFRADALLTYCIAIISSVVIDFLLENNFEIETKAIGVFLFGIVLLSIFFLLYFYVNRAEVQYGIIGTILTLALWLFCNANHPKYDEVNKSASIGGQSPSKGGLGNG